MSIEERIDWLVKLMKKDGYTGFKSIRKESAERGYTLALADVEQLFLDLSDDEKKDPIVLKLYHQIRQFK